MSNSDILTTHNLSQFVRCSKSLLLAVFACFSFLSYGQKGFIVSVDGGLGKSYQQNASSKIPNSSLTTNHWNFSSVTCWNINIGLHYKYKDWVFATGIAFTKDGYKRLPQFIVFSDKYGTLSLVSPNDGSVYDVLYYRHISIPLKVGYTFSLSKKLSIIPHLGVSIAYNQNSTLFSKHPDSTATLSGREFHNGYHSFSFYLATQVNLAYKVNHKLSVFIAPQFYYMLTSMVKNEAHTFEHSQFKLYNYSFNAGLSFELSK